MQRFTAGSKKAVLGGVVAASAATSAQGALIYVNPSDVVVTPSGSIYVDVEGGIVSTTTTGSDDLQFIVGGGVAAPAVDNVKPYANATALNGSLLHVSGKPITSVTKFAAGDEIGVPTSSNSSLNSPFTTWGSDTSAGYAGFSFISNGIPLYGWVQLQFSPIAGADTTVNSDDTAVLTLIDFGYEDSGSRVFAGGGAVPEPASSAIFAALAGSAALYRRRQAKTSAA